MKRYTKNILGILALLFMSIIFVSAGHAYRVEVVSQPANADPMKIGEEREFLVKAYTGEGEGSAEDKEMLIDKLFWQFDYTLLEKVSSSGSSIKLKAVSEGIGQLTANAIIGSYPFTKSLEIKIEK